MKLRSSSGGHVANLCSDLCSHLLNQMLLALTKVAGVEGFQHMCCRQFLLVCCQHTCQYMADGVEKAITTSTSLYTRSLPACILEASKVSLEVVLEPLAVQRFRFDRSIVCEGAQPCRCVGWLFTAQASSFCRRCGRCWWVLLRGGVCHVPNTRVCLIIGGLNALLSRVRELCLLDSLNFHFFVSCLRCEVGERS